MSENILKNILDQIYETDPEFYALPSFKLSQRHKLAMKRIFARFEKNTLKPHKTSSWQIPYSPKRRLSLKQKLFVVVAVIVCAAFLTGFVVIFFSKNFHGTVYNDNTHLFAVNTENCLQTIEYKYYLSELPEGFELDDMIISSFDVDTIYKNELSGQSITFSQYTKNHFSPHYNTENHDFEEIEINGHKGLCLDFSDDEHNHSLVVWDNEDYILVISGDLSKNDTIILAKSAEISKN